MSSPDPRFKVKIQICCGSEIAMGPGKADLLEAIAAEGSISAAGRALGMSYRRTWLLVDAMNRCWDKPLVEAVAGGGKGRGAHVTELGLNVLKDYRALQDLARRAEQSEAWRALQSGLRPRPKSARKGG